MRRLLPPLLLCLAGCHLIFPHAPSSDDGRGRDAPADLRSYRDLARDLARPDLARTDRQPLQGCIGTDPDTLAAYTFDDATSPYLDSTGSHTITKLIGALSIGAGAPGCGTGMQVALASGAPSYAIIAHDDDWNRVRAIELWVRFERGPPTEVEAILSRDATGTGEPGHFTLFRDCENRIVARLQQTSTGDLVLCSSAVVAEKAWTQIVMNFHPTELRVDGATALSTKPPCAAWLPPCASKGGEDLGIEGNTNPWILGGSLISSSPGTTDNVIQGMVGTIDELRFSSVQR